MFFNDVCELERIAEKLAKEAEVIPAPKDVAGALTDQHIRDMISACTAMDPSLKWVHGDGLLESITPLKMDWLRLLVRLRQAGIPDRAIQALEFRTASDGSVYVRVGR